MPADTGSDDRSAATLGRRTHCTVHGGLCYFDHVMAVRSRKDTQLRLVNPAVLLLVLGGMRLTDAAINTIICLGGILWHCFVKPHLVTSNCCSGTKLAFNR